MKKKTTTTTTTNKWGTTIKNRPYLPTYLPMCTSESKIAKKLGKRRLVLFIIVANLDESPEDNIDQLPETANPVPPRSFTVENENFFNEDEHLLRLKSSKTKKETLFWSWKKCKEWLQQQKINHEAELLVREFISATFGVQYAFTIHEILKNSDSFTTWALSVYVSLSFCVSHPNVL